MILFSKNTHGSVIFLNTKISITANVDVGKHVIVYLSYEASAKRDRQWITLVSTGFCENDLVHMYSVIGIDFDTPIVYQRREAVVLNWASTTDSEILLETPSDHECVHASCFAVSIRNSYRSNSYADISTLRRILLASAPEWSNNVLMTKNNKPKQTIVGPLKAKFRTCKIAIVPSYACYDPLVF